MNRSFTASKDPRLGFPSARSLWDAATVAAQSSCRAGTNLLRKAVQTRTATRRGSLQRGSAIVCSVIWVTLLLSIQGFGQLSTASVNGVVRDPSRAVIPNARIVLRNADTSIENTTVSNGAGAYAFLDIQPGRYTLEAIAPGFTPERLSVFTLTVSQIAAIDF